MGDTVCVGRGDSIGAGAQAIRIDKIRNKQRFIRNLMKDIIISSCP